MRFVWAVLSLLPLAALAFLAMAWRSEIDPVRPPPPDRIDPDLVAHGARLSALGNCDVCHTAPDGKRFAGGLAIPTPFGTLYSTNITPDPETGIGRWSLAAFRRAMHEGVDRRGRHLYPAFPYDHFTLVSEDDDTALYAYLMTRQPIRAVPPANRLAFPFNLRPLIVGWKLLFFRPGDYRPDGGHDETWNRGAYLIQGLGHCGACHTPRNALGAERDDAPFAGGEAEGWHAYALGAASKAPVPWDEAALEQYLRTGWQPLHGVARGPMAPVVADLVTVPAGEVHAIASYLGSLGGPPSPERGQRAEALAEAQNRSDRAGRPGSAGSQAAVTPPDQEGQPPGALVYAGACASCHEGGRGAPFGGIGLGLSSAVSGESPRNLLNVVVDGIPPAEGEAGPIMPGFGHALTDRQILDLAGHLRSRFGNQPPWDDLETVLRQVRSGRPQVAAAVPVPAEGRR